MLEATQLETDLAKALDKTPMNIRYYATRFLAELLVGRNLSKEERQRLSSKIGNSFPRDRNNGGYVVWSEQPIVDNVRAGGEILKIIERSRLIFEDKVYFQR